MAPAKGQGGPFRDMGGPFRMPRRKALDVGAPAHGISRDFREWRGMRWHVLDKPLPCGY